MKAADRDSALRRLGQNSYDNIMVKPKVAPIPEKMKGRPFRPTFHPGLEFARELLSKREVAATISARCKPKMLQHIVASKADDVAEKGQIAAPWQYRVTARCKAKLRRAAVKVERQFLDLDVCPKCWKTVAPRK